MVQPQVDPGRGEDGGSYNIRLSDDQRRTTGMDPGLCAFLGPAILGVGGCEFHCVDADPFVLTLRAQRYEPLAPGRPESRIRIAGRRGFM